MAEMIVQKQEFARIVGKSPARISQLISEGVISGDALVGQGRSAKVRVDVAKAQLAARLDPVRQLDQGQPLAMAAAGDADLFAQPARPAAVPSGASLAVDDHQTRYLKARADAAELDAAEKAAKAEAMAGRWLDTAAAEAEWSGALAQFVMSVETFLVTGAAEAVAALEAPTPRAVGQVLRREWMAFRARQAAEAEAPPAADPEDDPDDTETDP